MSRLVTKIRQVDGSVRRILAQDDAHAARARAILRRDRAMIDHLDDVEGIRITVRESRS